MAMGMGLQAWKVRAALEKRGIDPQAVDMEGHLDDSLSFRENLANLKDGLGLSLSSQEEDERWRSWEHEEKALKANGWEDPYAAQPIFQATLMQPTAPIDSWPPKATLRQASTPVRDALRRIYRLREPACSIHGCPHAPVFFTVKLAANRRESTMAMALCIEHKARHQARQAWSPLFEGGDWPIRVAGAA